MLNFIKCIWYVEKNLLLPNSHQVIDNYIELLIKLVCPGVIKSLPMKNSIIMLCRSPSKSFSHLSHLQFYLKIWHRMFSCEFYEIFKNTFFTEHLLCQLLQVESKGITYKDIRIYFSLIFYHFWFKWKYAIFSTYAEYYLEASQTSNMELFREHS